MSNFNFDTPVVSGFQSHITVNESETRNWFNEDGINNPFGSNYINPMDPQFNNSMCCSDSRRNIGNNMNTNMNPVMNCYPGSSFGFIGPELNGSSSEVTSSFFDNAPINNFVTNPINNTPTPIETTSTPTATQVVQNNNVGGLNSIIESRRNMSLTTVNNSNTVSNPWSTKSPDVSTTSIANTLSKPCCSDAFSNPYGITITDPYEVNKMVIIDDAKKGVAGRWSEELVARIPLEQPKVDWNDTSSIQTIDSLKDDSINKNATWMEIAEKNFKK